MRKIFQNGDILFAEDVNIIGRPSTDGQDLLGHGSKVPDTWLNDAPNQIKSRFYNFYNRLQVSHQTGLTFSFIGGVVLLANGTLASISPGSINVPNNTSSFIFVGSNGVVQQSSSIPNECFPMAFVVTSGGTIQGSVNDLRDKVIDRISPATVPVEQIVPAGSIIAFDGDNLPDGWLWCDGAEYATTAYPALFAAIGYKHGGSGATFRVADRRGRVSVGAGQGVGLTNRLVGQTGGAERVTLSTAQMPNHSHSYQDFGHNHGVVELPHNHGVQDFGHQHSLIPFRQYAEGNGRRGDGAELTTVPGGTNIYPNTAAATSNISIQANRTNISLNAATTGISINAQGGGGNHENMMPFLVNSYILKY